MRQIEGLDRYTPSQLVDMMGKASDSLHVIEAVNGWLIKDEETFAALEVMAGIASIGSESLMSSLGGAMTTGIAMGYMLREQLLADERAEALLADD